MSNGTGVYRLVAGLALALTCLIQRGAAGDSLHAQVLKHSFLPDEPLVVEVTVLLDEPVIVDFSDPKEAERQLNRLRRRYCVELRDRDGAKVAKSFLMSAPFMQQEVPSAELRTGGMAFWAMPVERNGGAPDLTSGNYIAVVLDREHGLASNDIPIQITAPAHAETEAAAIFRASLPGGIGLILAQKRDGPTLKRFAELARDYPETIYGRYAIVSLALVHYRETFAEHNNRGGAVVWGPVARELATVEGLFTGEHPLREKVLYDSASAHVLSEDYSGARERLAALKSMFPRGKLGSRSEELEREITQFEKQKRSAEGEEE